MAMIGMNDDDMGSVRDLLAEACRRIAFDATAALPVKPRAAEGVRPTSILCLEFDPTDIDATEKAIALLRDGLAENERLESYVPLELPAVSEQSERVMRENGPTLRLLRAFDMFPREGNPRVRTYFHVGIVESGADAL